MLRFGDSFPAFRVVEKLALLDSGNRTSGALASRRASKLERNESGLPGPADRRGVLDNPKSALTCLLSQNSGVAITASAGIGGAIVVRALNGPPFCRCPAFHEGIEIGQPEADEFTSGFERFEPPRGYCPLQVARMTIEIVGSSTLVDLWRTF